MLVTDTVVSSSAEVTVKDKAIVDPAQVVKMLVINNRLFFRTSLTRMITIPIPLIFLGISDIFNNSEFPKQGRKKN